MVWVFNMTKFSEKINWSDRWLRDVLKVTDPPGFFELIEVDMTTSKELIKRSRKKGFKLTYTHIIVRATAITLKNNPKLHHLVLGGQRFFPSQVDIGLSISGNTFIAPVMVLKDAGNKNLQALAIEIIDRTIDVRNEHLKMLTTLKKWGWIVPFGFLRRWIFRTLMQKFSFRRDSVGTFQISCLSSVDLLVPFMFYTSAVLGVGRVKDRVVAKNGKPVVCTTMLLACCVDHKVWDGVSTGNFLRELVEILESEKLYAEI